MKRVGPVALVAAVLTTGVACGVYYSKDLPRSNPVLMAVFPDDTVYAPGYRESRFRQVVPGMTVAELRTLLGEPLTIREHDAQGLFIRSFDPRDPAGTERRRWPAEEGVTGPPDEIGWSYSRHGEHFDNYYVRTVVITAAGSVAGKGAHFYTD